MEKNIIYLDNAATTKISDSVFAVMTPFLKENYGNASSIYSLGRQSATALMKARSDCAECLGCEPGELFFTSGGSESNNWAIKGIAELMGKNGKTHIISSEFEHHAVLHVLETLEKKGFSVTYLPVYENGIVKASDVEKAIRPETGFVTIMYANNEIGTIQPIDEIGSICKAHGVLFHTDAVQAVGNVHIDVKKQNIDSLSLSAHKIHAQKGVGALYINKKLRLSPYIEGGAQERGFRAGTENIAGIVGFSVALKEAVNGIDEKKAKLLPLRKKLLESIAPMERVYINGDIEHRLAGNLNFSFEGIEGEALLLQLDLKGIAASSGSACTSGSLDPSHVLMAIGRPHSIAHGSLRISMSADTTEAEIDELISVLPEIVEKLRQMSPLWEHIKKNEKV